jgi:hypothetical protein
MESKELRLNKPFSREKRIVHLLDNLNSVMMVKAKDVICYNQEARKKIVLDAVNEVSKWQ